VSQPGKSDGKGQATTAIPAQRFAVSRLPPMVIDLILLAPFLALVWGF
jgi:hypothetical protein